MLPWQQCTAELLILRSLSCTLSCLMQHSLGQQSASHQTCSVLHTPFHSPKEHPAIFPVPAMALDAWKTTQREDYMLLKSCRKTKFFKSKWIFFSNKEAYYLKSLEMSRGIFRQDVYVDKLGHNLLYFQYFWLLANKRTCKPWSSQDMLNCNVLVGFSQAKN